MCDISMYIRLLLYYFHVEVVDVAFIFTGLEPVMLSSLVSVRSSSVHIFAGERLQAFSDAVFAIIATLMVSCIMPCLLVQHCCYC